MSIETYPVVLMPISSAELLVVVLADFWRAHHPSQQNISWAQSETLRAANRAVLDYSQLGSQQPALESFLKSLWVARFKYPYETFRQELEGGLEHQATAAFPTVDDLQAYHSLAVNPEQVDLSQLDGLVQRLKDYQGD